MVASVKEPVQVPDPSAARLSFAECRDAARSVRRAEHGRRALAYLRPRGMAGVNRERPPLAVLLYLLSRRNLVVWRSPDEFVALRPPEAITMSGWRREVRLRWLDRWWEVLVVWLPPLLALLLAVPLIFVPMLRLVALLLAMAVLLYAVIAMSAPLLYGLLRLCRRFVGSVPDRQDAGVLFIQQNWLIQLCHVTDPGRTEDVLQGARDRIRDLVRAAEPDQAQGAPVTIVWDERCITTSAAREAACVAAEVTRIAETGVDLLIMREPGDESVPRIGVNVTDPVPFVGLFFLGVATIIAYGAYILSDEERAACGTQCDGRPADYGDALYWLLSHLVFLGDPGGLSPATMGARILGLAVTVLGAMTIGVVAAAAAQAGRAHKKKVQELEEKVRRSLEASTKAAWGSVFISYRKGADDLTVAGLYRTLSGRFGSDKVFLDIRSMPPGTPFPDELRTRLDDSKVLLAVIQQGWLKRLNQRTNVAGTDWVRFEISTALSAGKAVIPVLLNDVTLPTEDQLPPDMAELAHRQACRLRPTSLDEDVKCLITAIESHLRSAAESTSRPQSMH